MLDAIVVVIIIIVIIIVVVIYPGNNRNRRETPYSMLVLRASQLSPLRRRSPAALARAAVTSKANAGCVTSSHLEEPEQSL